MNMINLGIVRSIDANNRCTIPMEITREWGLQPGKNPLQYFKMGQYLVLAPYYVTCEFCAETESLIEFKGHQICPKCKQSIIEGSA